METNENFSPLKNAMNFGAMLGLASMLISFILQLLKIREGALAQILMVLIIGIFIVLGSNFYKKSNNGFMSYGQALGQGVLISLFGSILLAFFIYFYFQMASPESLQEIKDMAEIQLEEQGLDEKEFEMALKIQQMIMTPGMMALFTILGNMLIGTVISLITSAFLKKEDNSFESNFK
jgi:hypothetical protein